MGVFNKTIIPLELVGYEMISYPTRPRGIIVNYDVIVTALGGEHKDEQNRCRELVVLPKSHSKAFLKIGEYPSTDDFECKKRLHGV